VVAEAISSFFNMGYNPSFPLEIETPHFEKILDKKTIKYINEQA
jgi:hypothetical protein